MQDEDMQYSTGINITRLRVRDYSKIVHQIRAEAELWGLTIDEPHSIFRYRSFGEKIDFSITVRGADRNQLVTFASTLRITRG